MSASRSLNAIFLFPGATTKPFAVSHAATSTPSRFAPAAQSSARAAAPAVRSGSQ